jgi:hypothetical protein
MRNRTGFACIALTGVAAVLLSHSQGCGERTYFFNSSAIIRGEVSSVTFAAADGGELETRHARRSAAGWLDALGASSAFAQGGCAAASGAVLACTRMTGDSGARCARVDHDHCGFFKRVRIPSGENATIEFVDDRNDNGSADEPEPIAIPAAPLPFPICNGDRILLRSVSIDFTPRESGRGEWTAEAFVKQVDACPGAGAPPGDSTPE